MRPKQKRSKDAGRKTHWREPQAQELPLRGLLLQGPGLEAALHLPLQRPPRHKFAGGGHGSGAGEPGTSLVQELLQRHRRAGERPVHPHD